MRKENTQSVTGRSIDTDTGIGGASVVLHKNPDRYEINNKREIRCLNWIYLQDKMVFDMNK